MKTKVIPEFVGKTNISPKFITEQEKEDIGLLAIMMEVDRNEIVSREEVMKKLNS